jgi:DNA-binding transcriptional LysR family regulator
VVATWPQSPATLRLGYFQSVGATVLPQILRAFGARFPEVPVELELGDAERLLQEVVAGGALDLAFVSAPLRVDVLGSVHLASDPFVLLSPPDDTGEPDFTTRPLLAYKTCAVQRHHEDALVASGALPKSRIVCMEDAATIQGLVAAGCAYALLPRLAVSSTDVAVRVLEGPSRELHLVWQRSRTMTDQLKHFVAVTEAEFSTLEGSFLRRSKIA